MFSDICMYRPIIFCVPTYVGTSLTSFCVCGFTNLHMFCINDSYLLGDQCEQLYLVLYSMAESNKTLNDIVDDGHDSAMRSVEHIIHEGPHEDPQLLNESSDSAYNADTIIDSPTSTSSTLLLNVSEVSNYLNNVNDNNIDDNENVTTPCLY